MVKMKMGIQTQEQTDVVAKEREPNRFRNYYVIVSKMNGNEDSWLRLSWRSDAVDTEDKSLLYDLEDWR